MVPLAALFRVRLERCVGCNTRAGNTFDRVYGQRLAREALAPADDTDEPNHWQWSCTCGVLNVTKVEN